MFTEEISFSSGEPKPEMLIESSEIWLHLNRLVLIIEICPPIVLEYGLAPVL